MSTSSAAMTPEQQRLAAEMARNGKTIAQIQRTLGVDYWDAWDHVRSVGAYSWQGAKWISTRRLNTLVRERNPARRRALADEVYEMIEYMYYQGLRLGRTVDRVKRAIE